MSQKTPLEKITQDIVFNTVAIIVTGVVGVLLFLVGVALFFLGHQTLGWIVAVIGGLAIAFAAWLKNKA